MANNKRAALPWRVEYTRNFEKAWQRYNLSGRRDMHEAIAVMTLIFSRQSIPAIYLDHELKGVYAGMRELHIGGDFLLIYHVNEKTHTVTFTELGTHAELFE